MIWTATPTAGNWLLASTGGEASAVRLPRCPFRRRLMPRGKLMTPQTAYDQWIQRYSAAHGTLGRCRDAVQKMTEAFPELTEVRGHVHCCWGKRGHIWCVAPDGSIVDPTRDQFPGSLEYEPWRPGDEVLVGKCMNCGESIWATVETLDRAPEQQSVCSDACERELAAEYSTMRQEIEL